MRKTALLTLLIVLFFPCIGEAASRQLSVSANSSMVIGNFDVKSERDTRYFRYGIELKYYDKDNIEFKMIDGKFVVGSKKLNPELEFELGLKGLFGDVEKDDMDGSISGVGFCGSAAYTLPKGSFPIPIEFLGSLTYAPGPLSFQDLENYTELRLGVVFYIIEQAAVIVDYRHLMIDMDTSTGKWEVDKGSITLGIKLSW